MLMSKLFLPIQKEAPAGAQINSHILMLKAGLIKQTASGLYTWLPLGLKVLEKIKTTIRRELDAIGCNEILLPILQPSSFWQASGRYQTYGKEMLRVTDRHDNELVYGPTAEEAMVEIAKNDVKSYKQLPLSLYNIQFKFRDEIRPRFGVMRSREFIMLDSYSFDVSEAEAVQSYKNHFDAFLKIFLSLGLDVLPVEASVGEIGGSLSHEFCIIAPNGESDIFAEDALLQKITELKNNPQSIENSFDTITNYFTKTDEKIAEIANVDVKTADINAEASKICGAKKITKHKAIELGHCFYFGDKYSKPMQMQLSGEDGKLFNPQMGSYGIGPARIIAAYIELNNDKDGIIWNKQLTPFDIILINIIKEDESYAKSIYAKLTEAGFSVLFDDTKDSPGQKFAKADLIGVPTQVIVSQKLKDANSVEVKDRKTGQKIILHLDSLLQGVC